MTKRLQRGASTPTHPLWLRVLAMACLLLVGAASSAQAVHVHGQWLPHASISVGAPAVDAQNLGGEEHCPLCVAMHSALPVSMHVEPVRLVLVVCVPPQLNDRVAANPWHFDLFSRPPPILETL